MDLKRIEKGFFVHQIKSRTKPAVITVADKSRMFVKVLIAEGKKRQIRYSFKNLGYNVLKLKKFDYADHPLAKELTPVSILDYTPPHAAAPFLQTETTLPRAVSEERPHTSSIPSKRRTLYSSAKPPSEF